MKFGTVLRSPLVHFFLLGGAIFALYDGLNPADTSRNADTVLHLTPQQARGLAGQFSATWNRQPTATEMETVMQNWALEEAMVREARLLGLDQDDSVIRNRLRQKMLFLAEAPAATATPDDQVLLAFYEENAARFTRPARLSFQQVLLPPDAGKGDTQAMLAALEAGAPPSQIGQTSLLPQTIEALDVLGVDRVFGAGTGDAISRLPVGAWSGPVQSGYGYHLVRLAALTPPALPPLDDVRDRVLSEWRTVQMREVQERFSEAVLDRYTIELPQVQEVLGQ